MGDAFKYVFKVLLSFLGLLSHFLLALNNISLSGWTLVYLSSRLLRGILVPPVWSGWIRQSAFKGSLFYAIFF